ncbi:tetraacyldisaccharide 4'-kinase [Piscinibacter sp. HJYY11]|uniref:tetraacyldisaccharide 4'-kinase n=1 Tax=Piscinibacter sp. HJYY11 TaxID=2801333 RepID=UPI00191F0154|nr:tetraacyldisaccharide 4'-kinase [Piscinibacter sp. HJYY11]MBL0726307.1 tetraacyldisaccharide 4'-kinase [Piscinibacter sp. HJYY11]
MPAASTLQEAWLRRGAIAWLLWPLSWLYGVIIALRAAGYRMGLLRTHRLPVPVLVVGNLIVGGAGKTPTTMALIQLLRTHGHRPGIVSRGYGRSVDEPQLVTRDTPAGEAGDEPLLMHLRTTVPVAVGADRVAAGLLLLKNHPDLTVLVSDDGLQHHRLARDAQVIVFDERGGGNGWLLPAGPLREPVPAEVPARSLVVYNASRASTPLPGHQAQRRLRGLTPLADWWAGRAASPEAFVSLQGRKVIAAAGMARPQRYFEMLRAQGLQIDELPLPDHHPFTTLPWPATATDVIATEKDAVKLRPGHMGSTRVWVATLDFEIDPAIASQLLPWLTPTT